MGIFENIDFNNLPEDYNENSVREDIIAPLLKILGYSSFDKLNYIVREPRLEQPFTRIGTKNVKINIIPDYLIKVNGKNAFIIEAKSPQENICNGKNVEQAYSYAINRKVQVKRFVLCYIILFYSVCPMFPLFAVSMWKDPIFSMALVIYSLELLKVCRANDRNDDAGRHSPVPCCLSLLLVCLFRSNGVFIALFMLFILLIIRIFLRKEKNIFPRFFILSHIAVIAFTFILTGPVYDMAGVIRKDEEGLSLPLQQIAACVVYEGEMNESELEVVSTILPLERYKGQQEEDTADLGRNCGKKSGDML